MTTNVLKGENEIKGVREAWTAELKLCIYAIYINFCTLCAIKYLLTTCK